MNTIRNFILCFVILAISVTNSFASDFLGKSDKEYMDMNTYISKITDETLKKEISKFYSIAIKASCASQPTQYIKKLEKTYNKIRLITDNVVYAKIPSDFELPNTWNNISRQCEKINQCINYTIRNISKNSIVNEQNNICKGTVKNLSDAKEVKKYLVDKLSKSIFGFKEKKNISNCDGIVEDYSKFAGSDLEKVKMKISKLRNTNDITMAVAYLQDICQEAIVYQKYEQNPQHNIMINQVALSKNVFSDTKDGFVLFFRGSNTEPSFVLREDKIWLIHKIDYKSYGDNTYGIIINAWDFEDILYCHYGLVGKNDEEKEQLSYVAYNMKFYNKFESEVRRSILKVR